jgi:CheY-like chemotaxis protein
MTKPLAIIFYEELLPGSQLVNRLQDLGYRVQTINDSANLAGVAAKEPPMLILMDLRSRAGDLDSVIGHIKESPQTKHVPILAYAGKKDRRLQENATRAGASLVAFDDAILQQLPHLLEQVLQVD